jgi:hypothetical protein
MIHGLLGSATLHAISQLFHVQGLGTYHQRKLQLKQMPGRAGDTQMESGTSQIHKSEQRQTVKKKQNTGGRRGSVVLQQILNGGRNSTFA